jgi:hypothetical protein
MAEQAPVFRGMVLQQGRDAVRAMTLIAEFFRCFFLHGHEAFMILVMRQPGRSFRRRKPEEQKDACTEHDKKKVVYEYFFLLSIFFCTVDLFAP